ncbi:SdpI family protein [Rothia nasimurium]|uniref:SdpI family protein n=1 Tax=Rothia nasimurium TaxID=85336 RepID=UPI001F471FAA|nr:SdpI family protein [Rothia nasimurium]
MSAADYLPLVFCLLLLGGLFLTIARMGAAGTLRRNGLVGVRTTATMQSDAAWYAAHKAIAPTLRACAWAQIVGAAVVLILGLMAHNSAVIPVGLAFLILPTIAMMVVAMTRGTSAANDAHRAWEQDQQTSPTHR